MHPLSDLIIIGYPDETNGRERMGPSSAGWRQSMTTVDLEDAGHHPFIRLAQTECLHVTTPRPPPGQAAWGGLSACLWPAGSAAVLFPLPR